MKILLDTNAFLWAATSDVRLSSRARELLLAEDSELFVSVASLWEMTIKFQIGKLKLPTGLEQFIGKQLSETALSVLSIHPEHITALSAVPLLHRDPFDRMLVAQSLSERMPLMGSDKEMGRYPVEIIW